MEIQILAETNDLFSDKTDMRIRIITEKSVCDTMYRMDEYTRRRAANLLKRKLFGRALKLLKREAVELPKEDR